MNFVIISNSMTLPRPFTFSMFSSLCLTLRAIDNTDKIDNIHSPYYLNSPVIVLPHLPCLEQVHHGLETVELGLTQELVLFLKVLREIDLCRPHEVQNMPEQLPIPVNEVVPTLCLILEFEAVPGAIVVLITGPRGG